MHAVFQVEIAEQHGIWLHADACIGGFVLPFAEALGRPVPTFDFRLPAVQSMSIDYHKYGYAMRGCSAIILRDRTGHAFGNASSVGNLYVLNAAVVHPKSGVLWHSTTLQPHAAFGEYVPFRPVDPADDVEPLPVAPELAGEAMQAEAQAIARARRAIAHQRAGELALAETIWSELAEGDPPRLDPARIAKTDKKGLKFGPFRKAEYYETFEGKFHKCQKWFKSGRFMKEFLREFEKNCQKLSRQ